MIARRATVEDLPQLLVLWRLERLPADQLEKRLTEFQVVVDEAQILLAAVGLQISAHHGLLHNEAIARPELADQARQLLWERLQRVAVNHSIDRLWTKLPFPFWRNLGFRAPTDEELAGLPEACDGKNPAWQTLPLRTGDASSDAIEKQFAMLRALNSQEAGQFKRRALLFKRAAMALILIVLLLITAWAVVLFRYGPKFLQR